MYLGLDSLARRHGPPGKNLTKFIAATFSIPDREQSILLEAISDSVADTVPLVRDRMAEQPLFRDIGKRMLLA
jgi:serine/threonine-protein kinase HipA